jgi:hypothetical protein
MARGNFDDNMTVVELLKPDDGHAAGGPTTGTAVAWGACQRGVLLVPLGDVGAAGKVTVHLAVSNSSTTSFETILTSAFTIATTDASSVKSAEFDTAGRAYIRAAVTVATLSTTTFGVVAVGWHAPVVPVA